MLSEKIIVGCDSTHSCRLHSQQVLGMNREFMFEQLSLMGSSFSLEAQLTAPSWDSCICQMQPTFQDSHKGQQAHNAALVILTLAGFFKTNMDYLINCTEHQCIENLETTLGVICKTVNMGFFPNTHVGL